VTTRCFAVTFESLSDAEWFSDLLHDRNVTGATQIRFLPLIVSRRVLYRLYWWATT
jgi:hypothetical protein